MSERLLPCPFCGGEAIVFGYHDVFWEAECLRCHGAAGDYETKAEAIDAWNTRVERTCRDIGGLTDFECSSCGYALTGIREMWKFCPDCGARVVWP